VPAGEGIRDGFDYVAEPADAGDLPILGVAQTFDDSSANPLLLRLLCCLTEFAPARRLNVVNTDLLKGALQPDARFDLHIVLWDEGDPAPSLCELTRELAEMARDAMADTVLGERVGRIHCLRIDPGAFDGELKEMWRI